MTLPTCLPPKSGHCFVSDHAAPVPNLFAPRAFWFGLEHSKEEFMDKEHLKGAADKAKGAVKDAAGKATGDKKMQAEGKFDKAKGAAHNVAGDVKDAAKQTDRS